MEGLEAIEAGIAAVKAGIAALQRFREQILQKAKEKGLLQSDEDAEVLRHDLAVMHVADLTKLLLNFDEEFSKPEGYFSVLRKRKRKREPAFSEADRKALARAFRAKFIDPQNGLTTLLDQLDRRLRLVVSSPLAIAATSVIQSSGTGKTRSIVELSTLGVFVCYCSFQEKSGFPLRTTALANTLLDESLDKESHCRAYLRSWLQCLSNYLEGSLQLSAPDAASSSTSASSSSHWTNEHIYLEVGQKSRIIDTVDSHWQSTPLCNDDELKDAVEQVYPGLLRKHESKVGILFVFDEASMLFERGNVGYNLRRALMSLRKAALGVFIDTSSKFSVLAPSLVMDPSQRARTGELVVPDPVWQISNINSLTGGFREFVNLGKLKPRYIYRYGRPLWASWADSKLEENQNVDTVLKELIDVAARKLCGGIQPSLLARIKQGLDLTGEAAMAILGARLVVDVNPQSRLAANLVANHMRFVLNISEDKTSILTCEGWDPIITDAACDLFREEELRCAALQHLVACTESGLIDEGKNGELLARYILLRAKDEAKNPEGYVFLGDFMLKLCVSADVDDQWHKEVRTFWEDKSGPARILRKGLINFEGFHPVIGHTPSVSDLLKFFFMKKALICKTNQVGFDMLIPLLLPSRKGRYNLDPKKISILGIQVKSIRGDVTLLFEASVLMNPVGAKIGDWDVGQPYATLLMQLGHTGLQRATHVDVPIRETRSQRLSAGSQFSYIVYGLEDVYTFLTSAEAKLLCQMIHGRRHPITVSGVENFARKVIPLAFHGR